MNISEHHCPKCENFLQVQNETGLQGKNSDWFCEKCHVCVLNFTNSNGVVENFAFFNSFPDEVKLSELSDEPRFTTIEECLRAAKLLSFR